jgi:hypothetical protein
MKYTYEVVENLLSSVLKRTDENGEIAWIPFDEGNSDYQRYLNPEAEQSTPSVTNGD